MLYYLSLQLTPYFGAFNVFSYHTVRSGGALITGFLFTLVVGPRLIEWLRQLKIGQYIKKEHVDDLHELHKSKAGTPTMGGLIIIVATVLSLLLWSTLTNRLLLVATGVLCLMGLVGFLDDFIKLRRKRNDGLSAGTKLLGQFVVGGLLGAFVVLWPITYGASNLTRSDVLDWKALIATLEQGGGGSPLGAMGVRLSEGLREDLAEVNGSGPAPETRDGLLREMNILLARTDVIDYSAIALPENESEAKKLLGTGPTNLNTREVLRLNRLILDISAPGTIASVPRQLHTKVGIPGMKDAFIPLGYLYIGFVILIVVATSNSVNITDGLDGLAVGASVISIATFTAIAYVVSRADWSSYLFVTFIPEASELTVFGSALLGTGLGFLWFNAHPAEVFMGDTGSLSLGGVMGAMAVLTKQELLLPIVGGLFVLEALSVIIQVGSFKLTGNRVFRMAPLHHHFELKGWSESKITIRFWILALMFALMSLTTLKLR